MAAVAMRACWVASALAPRVRAECAPPGAPRSSPRSSTTRSATTPGTSSSSCSTPPAPLRARGRTLEAGDGSGPGRWTLRWTGGPQRSRGGGRAFRDRRRVGSGGECGRDARSPERPRRGAPRRGPTAPPRSSATARTSSPSTRAAFPRPMRPPASRSRACPMTPPSASTPPTSARRRRRPGSRTRWRATRRWCPASLALEPAHPESGATMRVRAAVRLARGCGHSKPASSPPASGSTTSCSGPTTIPRAVTAADTAWSEITVPVGARPESGS